MALSLLETDAGRAAFNDMLAHGVGVVHIPYSDVFQSMSRERWPQYVYYRNGKVEFIDRDTFAWEVDPQPSDCVWIIPGAFYLRKERCQP